MNASCADPIYDPDMWHPQEVAGSKAWAYKPAVMETKTICIVHCPLRDACLEYALRWDIIYGIWGGTDRYERAELQRERRIVPEPFLESYRQHQEYAVSTDV